MKIRLLSDFRGKITNERFYVAGEYVVPGEMPAEHAHSLIADNRAVEISPPKPAKRSRKKTSK